MTSHNEIYTPEKINPSYRYYNVVFIPLVATALIGLEIWTLPFIFILSFVVHAVVDSALVKYNLEKKIYIPRSNPNHKNYHIPMLLCVPVQVVVTICSLIYPYESMGQAIAAGVVVGVSGGIIGLSSGHELIHRNSKFQKNLGFLVLFCINYPYFAIEHMWHHINLATEVDSDVARKGETVYRFIPRSIPMGWLTCWKWETEKLKKKGRSAITLDNRMLKFTLIQVLIFIGIIIFFGLQSFLVFALSGIVAISILKWADYIEHYGIVRKIIDGKREPISRRHSWDSVNYLTNFTLFNLGHHSHHHHIASVPYYKLEASKDNPNTLPHGYTTLMLLALFPSRWFKYMQPHLIRNGHI
jgi:alkane 1-monooxygenase